MDNPLISVIVPVYNVEKYLDKCVESIVNQTYKNLEIILVDDGSPDNCPTMCDAWTEKDSRIKVIHKENGGVSSARNIGLDNVTGDFVTFVDSDDWIDADTIGKMKDIVDCDLCDIACVGFCYEYLSDTPTSYIGSNFKYEGEEILYNYLMDNIRPEACSKLYSYSVIGDVRFDSSIKYAEDLEFNYRAIKKAKCISSVDEAKYHYLQDSGNSSTTQLITDFRVNSYKVFERILEENKSNEKLCCAALNRFTVATLAIISRVMQDKDFTDKYYAELVNAVTKRKKDIFKNRLISKRRKLIVFGLWICPKLMLKLSER